ncbi:MAG: SpoIIE family protein phosphatase [Sphingobacteriaceae bacterium]|nr:SpoIIE family protein phosphatase [Sphingobacteriaceae bacterium]
MYLDSSISYATKIHDFAALMTIYDTYSDYYSNLKNFEKANDFYKLKFAAKDSLLQQSRDKEFIEMSTKYGTEKKEAENKLLKTESEKQKAISIGISIGLALFGLLSFFIFRSYKQKQKANILLEAQNNEIIEKKNIIEEKQKEILDSISYAKRLQEAILPPIDSLNKYFESAFIYYKPKDIVAGDFYWMENRNDYTFIAAADCTGHGVPGAMVSVVCSNALNRAVLEFNITDPGKILDKTRDLVLETFSKSDKDVRDGMDISLVAINNKTKELKWAGSNNRLWYTQDGKMAEITANKQPIGKTEAPTPFTTHTIQLQKNSSLFLFTDGYADQFGGPKGKKFKYKELQSILLQNATLSSSEQSEKLNSAFVNWKGNLEQVDDVCVIGLRV